MSSVAHRHCVGARTSNLRQQQPATAQQQQLVEFYVAFSTGGKQVAAAGAALHPCISVGKMY
jgi:hypothetical protein